MTDPLLPPALAAPAVLCAPPVLPERERVLLLLKRHGWNTTSFQTLLPGFRYFFDGPDACVAYVDTGGAWVAAGAPIAPPDEEAAVAGRFIAAAQAQGRRARFFAVEERFARTAPLHSLLIGEQPVFDPLATGKGVPQAARQTGIEQNLLIHFPRVILAGARVGEPQQIQARAAVAGVANFSRREQALQR